LVYYPYDSSYEKLLSKLRQFQDKKFSDPDIAKKGIVSILQTGAIDSSFNISADFEHFLMIFTYHLFHTEIQRHPSAAIHNVIGLDLVIKHKYSIEYIFTSLPMTIKGAMSVVRTLQTNLQTKLSIPYFYDKASSDNLVSEISSSEFEDFIEKENDLISKLITKYKLKDKPIQLIVGKIDELCEEYYGIKLCGEDIDMTLDYNICT
jgi:hypothetical protein